MTLNVKLTLRIDQEMMDELERISMEDERSINSLIVRAIKKMYMAPTEQKKSKDVKTPISYSDADLDELFKETE